MLVNTIDSLKILLSFINSSELLAYDTETTGLNTRKDKVIGFGISDAKQAFYVPIYDKNLVRNGLSESLITDILLLLKTKKLLMFNASFDSRVTKSSLGIDLLPALHADVLLLKHCCDEEMPFGLKEIATKLWGTEVKAEKEAMQASIKANGGTAKEYYKASTELLAKYCEQDCLLTFKLFDYYGRQLKEQGLEDFFYRDEVMPLYVLVTIPMEEAGVKLDIVRLNQSLIEINQDLDTLERGIQDAILPHLGIFTTWFLNKDYPLQTPTGKEPAWAKKYASQWLAWKSSNIDKHMFNLRSKYHLKKLFFDTLKLEPLSKTPTGQPQVDEEFLELISEQLPWVKLLIEFNKLTKLKGTYIERLLEGAEGSRYYPAYKQHGTVSGRFSGDMQQLPKPIEEDTLIAKYTNRIREFIIPEAGYKLISADYEQLEPRVFCHASTDEALAAMFNSGQDFYSEVARSTEKLTEVTKSQRQKAKSYALGIAYGMTGYKLKFELGCTDEEADLLVDKYLTAFPKLKVWMHESKQKALSQGYIKTQAGRIRHLLGAKQLYAKYGPKITDSLQLWRDFNDKGELYQIARQDYRTFKNLQNNAINFQVQGLAASIVNRASIAINKQLKTEQLKTKLIGQIHDELVYEAPDSEVERVSAIIKHLMESTTKLSVPLITHPKAGTNFRLCK